MNFIALWLYHQNCIIYGLKVLKTAYDLISSTDLNKNYMFQTHNISHNSHGHMMVFKIKCSSFSVFMKQYQ